MAHEREALWPFACGELSREDAARVAAHLALCGDCTQALDEVRTARGLLGPSAVPSLGEARWKAVDATVLAAAERALARPGWMALFDWLKVVPLGAWAGAAVAAAAAALVLFWPAPPARTQPGVALAPAPPVPKPPPPALAVGQVLVAAAKHARSNGNTVTAHTALPEGTALSTDRQGELWLSLPDGSRAGLMASAAVRVDRAVRDDVRVRVERGTLLVVAAHGAEAPLSVRAGDVEIHVSSSRFLVERDENGVSVAVQEGVVEAELGGAIRRVTPGQSVRFEKGRSSVGGVAAPQRVLLARLDASPRTRPLAEPVAAQRAVEPPTPAIPAGEAPRGAPDAPPDAVPAMAAGEGVPENGMTPAPWPVASAPSAAVTPAPDAGTRVTRRFQVDWPPLKLPFDIHNPLVPLNMTPTEDHVRQIVDLADCDECDAAVARADGWLASADGGGSPELRRRVILTKARCLRKLGRDDEARETERQR